MVSWLDVPKWRHSACFHFPKIAIEVVLTIQGRGARALLEWIPQAELPSQARLRVKVLEPGFCQSGRITCSATGTVS